MEWYFNVSSNEYGMEQYGPYSTKEEAEAGEQRVAIAAIRLDDGVKRAFTEPYALTGG